MKPYAHLDIPYKLITHRLQQFVKSNDLVNEKSRSSFLTKFDTSTIHKAIPELSDLFAQYGLDDILYVCIIRAKRGIPVYPHRDVLPLEQQLTGPKRVVAVNWPIFNCNNTFTAFYNEKPNIKNTSDGAKLLGSGIDYFKYDLDQITETHRIKIEAPTAFRFDRIHAVINDTDQDRLTASFRFESNHWELFEENYGRSTNK